MIREYSIFRPLQPEIGSVPPQVGLGQPQVRPLQSQVVQSLVQTDPTWVPRDQLEVRRS